MIPEIKDKTTLIKRYISTWTSYRKNDFIFSIVEILYPNELKGEEETQWTQDEIERIAELVYDNKLHPDQR